MLPKYQNERFNLSAGAEIFARGYFTSESPLFFFGRPLFGQMCRYFHQQTLPSWLLPASTVLYLTRYSLEMPSLHMQSHASVWRFFFLCFGIFVAALKETSPRLTNMDVREALRFHPLGNFCLRDSLGAGGDWQEGYEDTRLWQDERMIKGKLPKPN